MGADSIDPLGMIRPRRKVMGISAILLPFEAGGAIDWDGFRDHVRRTAYFGLVPAVNMDTGYVNLLDDSKKAAVLDVTREAVSGGPFVAGAYVDDLPNDPWDRDATLRAVEAIATRGGTPIIFPSFGLSRQRGEGIVSAHVEIGRHCDAFYAFELSQKFSPRGAVYPLDIYEQLMGIPACKGAKHSSLHRHTEWQRLILRDRVRPGFRVFTGNDLAIDMIMYGSDYLLGLSTFAPDLFARRDVMWASGDPAFFELNDTLQYLGQFAFRAPVPAYKHSAAMFLALRGWIASDRPHPGSPTRPESDRAVLLEIATRLGVA